MGFALECLPTLITVRKALSLHCDGTITIVEEVVLMTGERPRVIWGLLAFGCSL